MEHRTALQIDRACAEHAAAHALICAMLAEGRAAAAARAFDTTAQPLAHALARVREGDAAALDDVRALTRYVCDVYGGAP